MAERSYFFPSIGGDRKYYASDLSDFEKARFTNGIVAYGDQLAVTEDSGMNVTFSTGYAMVEGTPYANTAPITVAIDPANADLPRIDRIILRRSTANREVTRQTLKGIPDATPTPPNITRDVAGNWDLVVADITVGAAVTEITSLDITPQILNTELCGIMTPRTEFDTSAIVAQIEAIIALMRYNIEQTVLEFIVAHAFSHTFGGADPITYPSVEFTLDADDWDDGEYEITFADIPDLENITENTIITILPSASSTAEQREAWRSAQVVHGDQVAETSITLLADGDAPAIDIPVVIVFGGEME